MSFGKVEGIVSGAGGGTPWYLGNSFQTVLLIAAVGATTLLMLYPAADEAVAASLPETEPQNIMIVDEQEQLAPAEETNTETLNIDSTPTQTQTQDNSTVEEVVASQEEDASPTMEPTEEEESPSAEATEDKQEEVNSGEDGGQDITPVVDEQPVEEEKSEYVSRNTVLENALVDELVKSGLVDDPDNFYLKLTSRSLKVNGEKLSRDAHMSLRNLFESTADKELAAGSYVILEKVGGQSKLDMKITDFE